VSVVNIGPDSQASKVTVTPEQVKAYYESHAAEFTTPEQVRVEYVELSVDALAAKTPAAPEEVQRAYDEGVTSGRFGTKEERKASHVLIAVKPDAKEEEKKAAEQKAKQIAEAVRKNPKSFADVAKKESQDPGSAPQGGDLGFFSRGAMVKPFEDAAFAAKKDEIVGPVQSEFGWHVIQVTDIKPAKVKSLAEATPEIEAALRKSAAQRRFAELAEQFSNTVYEQPTSLKPAADAVGIAIQQSPWLSKGRLRVAHPQQPEAAGRDLLGRDDQGQAQHVRGRGRARTCWSRLACSSTSPRRSARSRPCRPISSAACSARRASSSRAPKAKPS
jgi:peptidyl-prolyl cis-trans isomerase D